MLSDPVERGLDPEQGTLVVIDGAKALPKAIRSVFGELPVQRCVRHKERNVLRHLPERTGTAVAKFHDARDILPPPGPNLTLRRVAAAAEMLFRPPPEGPCKRPVSVAAEGHQCGGDEGRLVDRCLVVLLEEIPAVSLPSSTALCN